MHLLFLCPLLVHFHILLRTSKRKRYLGGVGWGDLWEWNHAAMALQSEVTLGKCYFVWLKKNNADMEQWSCCNFWMKNKPCAKPGQTEEAHVFSSIHLCIWSLILSWNFPWDVCLTSDQQQLARCPQSAEAFITAKLIMEQIKTSYNRGLQKCRLLQNFILSPTLLYRICPNCKVN